MEFRLDEEELRRFAQIEEEVNCDISAGVDWGSHRGRYLAQINETVDHEKLLEILQERLGNVLSREELEDAARSIQNQMRNRIIEKLQSSKTA